jgi:Protein of unknown function (DUF4232)
MLAPPRPPAHEESEALIREARARQRKRWLAAAALLALAAGTAMAVSAVLPASHRRPTNAANGPLAAASARPCRAGQLRLGKPSFDGAYTAHVVDNLTFTNASSRRCSLRGWPTIEAVLPGDRTVPARAGRVRNATSSAAVPTRTIVLAPGAAASFHAIENDGTGLDNICPMPLPAVQALVVPPGSRVPVRRAVSIPYCHNPRRPLVYLSPVVAGRLDRYISR